MGSDGQTIEFLIKRNEELETEIQSLRKQQYDINKAKELYLKIFEEFPALIWRSGLDKLCNYFNKTWLDFTGRSMEEEYGNGWAENVHPEDFDFCLKTYVDAFDRREAFLMEYRMKNRFGEYRWIRDFGRPFYDLDESFAGYIGSCYDVTEIKLKEQKLLELNATKDKFFSLLAHDLRNPFQNLMGYAELLKTNFDKYNREKLETLTDRLYNTAKNTYDLAENLLIWANCQRGRIAFNPEWLELKTFFQFLVPQLNSLASDKNIVLQFDYQSNLFVFADNNMLSTVLRNLITNAIKFSFSEKCVVIRVEETSENWVFLVQDNGIGMSQETVNGLFRIDTPSRTGTQKEKGTGLGLILCKEFVEKHQGKIWAESIQGQGSVFTFFIAKKITELVLESSKSSECDEVVS